MLAWHLPVPDHFDRLAQRDDRGGRGAGPQLCPDQACAQVMRRASTSPCRLGSWMCRPECMHLDASRYRVLALHADRFVIYLVALYLLWPLLEVAAAGRANHSPILTCIEMSCAVVVHNLSMLRCR